MLTKIKTLLGIEDMSRDTLLNTILELVKGRLCILINEDSVPAKLEHIVVEVAVIRYNRLGSEGVSNHTVEGEAMAFGSDDFAGYNDEINEYLKNKVDSTARRVRFI